MKYILSFFGLCFFSFLFVFGISHFSVFESNESIFPMMYSGSLSQGVPLDVIDYGSHFILKFFYLNLYEKFPSFPIYETVMLSYVALTLLILFLVVFKIQKTSKLNLIISVILILTLSTEWVFFIQYTRVAFALGLVSTLLFIYAEKFDAKSTPWIGFVLFCFCILTRFETGVFVLIFQWLLFFLTLKKGSPKFFIVLSTIVTLIIISYFTIDRLTTNDFIMQFEPELGYQLLDRGNIVPIGKMTNAIDSAKYIAAKNMICDPNYITIPFLKSLVGEDAYIGIDLGLIKRCGHVLLESISMGFGLFLIYISLFVAKVAEMVYIEKNRKERYRFIVFHSLFWLIILATIYLIKMQTWVFNSILVFISLILLSQIKFSLFRINRLVVSFSVFILFVGICILFKNQTDYSKEIRSEIVRNKILFHSLEKEAAGFIIVPDINYTQVLQNRIFPFEKPDFLAFKKIYFLDADVLYVQKNYNKYLKKECRCDAMDYVAIMDFLLYKKEKVLFISSSSRLLQIANYCKIVRKREYHFEAIKTTNTSEDYPVIFKIIN